MWHFENSTHSKCQFMRRHFQNDATRRSYLKGYPVSRGFWCHNCRTRKMSFFSQNFFFDQKKRMFAIISLYFIFRSPVVSTHSSFSFPNFFHPSLCFSYSFSLSLSLAHTHTHTYWQTHLTHFCSVTHTHKHTHTHIDKHT